jgi:Rrf2 family protein
MFELTKKADYGLMLLATLAEKGRGGRVSLTELSQLGLPRSFVAKIAGELVEAGIINSKEGKGGGYSLNYEPEEIMLKEALEVIEGKIEPVDCDNCGASDGCCQAGFMSRLTKEINKLMDKYTVADLIK